MKKEYYLCTGPVVEAMQPEEVSKPVNFDRPMFIALLNFDKVKEFYEANGEPDGFQANELVPGTMNVEALTLKRLVRSDNLAILIEDEIGLTACRNVAMTIHNIAAREGISPIELFNNLYNEKNI